MSGDHQAHFGSGWRQGNRWAIVECSGHPTFRVMADLGWGTGQHLLNNIQIKEMIGPTSHDHRQASREHIEERSGIAHRGHPTARAGKRWKVRVVSHSS